jgi:DNA-binding SARP family transcriptional activator
VEADAPTSVNVSRDEELTAKRVRVDLLGGFRLTRRGRPLHLPIGCQRLVALLALQATWLRRAHVAGTLWMEAPEERAGACLRSALWRIRRAESSLIEATSAELRLAPSVHVDVLELASLARGALEGSRLADNSLGALVEAGDLLPDWDDEWVVTERERIRQLRLHALERLCEELTTQGRFGVAVETGLQAVAGDPLRESAHRVLIKAYLAEGNVAEATRQFGIYRRLAREELGVEPSSQAQDLVRGLRTS